MMLRTGRKGRTMTEETSERTQRVIRRLQERGLHDQAARFERVLAGGISDGLLFALREICQTALTAIEAIDPTTETMLEELRLEIDKRLARHRASERAEGRETAASPGPM
jgi:hypothetical protein